MKPLLAKIKNVEEFSIKGQALLDASVKTPRIFAAFGEAGFGKTATVSNWALKTDAVYVRASATWKTAQPMLRTICEELGLHARRENGQTVKLIVEAIARGERPIPIVFDEADHIVRCGELLDVIRELHDLASTPIVLIGMKHFARKLLSLADQEQFVSRISQFLEFKPLDREDAGTLVRTIADVIVADDLIDRMFREAEGNTRLMVVALEQIENFAKARALKEVDATKAAKLKLSLDRRPEILDRLHLSKALAVGV
jgi:DNA transposition AAA+ family ATPase